MEFMESRLLGIQIDESGREASLSIISTSGVKFTVGLHGLEKLLVNELLQQNVIEKMTHWKRGKSAEGLREVAFALMTGVLGEDCTDQLAVVALKVVDRVNQGEIEMMEISAVFGAQILALFASMTITR